MAVYTRTKTYHTKAHMGMIDVTEDFQDAVTAASPLASTSSASTQLAFAVSAGAAGVRAPSAWPSGRDVLSLPSMI